jgi:hypothetical protein
LGSGGIFILEATMQLPLFIETSKGHVNLALVTHIAEHANELVFVFERTQVGIPAAEGKSLMKVLLPLMRERLRDWELGMVK